MTYLQPSSKSLVKLGRELTWVSLLSQAGTLTSSWVFGRRQKPAFSSVTSVLAMKAPMCPCPNKSG